MKYRTFGRAGWRVSGIGYGMWGMAGWTGSNDEESLQSLERAVELAEAAQKINPESGAVADTLGWIYRDMGQLDKSSKMLSDASQLAPDNGEIAYHYAVVLNDTGEVEKARQILLALKNNNMQFPSRKLADDLLEDL